MPLETGDYICDLVETNPLGSDNVSQGDDHIRLCKKILKQSFPAICGPVTATHEELSNAGKSLMPTVTTYTTPSGNQSHTLQAGTSWVRVYLTGGGAGGGNSDDTANGGGGGATAIKAISVGDATAISYSVGSGGAAGGAAGGITAVGVDGTNISAEGGLYTTDTNTVVAVATGGDINIPGSAGHAYSGRDSATQGVGGPGMGGATYWGGAMNNRYTGARAYGTGGRGRTFSESATPGMSGVVVIEEY